MYRNQITFNSVGSFIYINQERFLYRVKLEIYWGTPGVTGITREHILKTIIQKLFAFDMNDPETTQRKKLHKIYGTFSVKRNAYV